MARPARAPGAGQGSRARRAPVPAGWRRTAAGGDVSAARHPGTSGLWGRGTGRPHAAYGASV
eukprot:5988984-Lingulodinium_polyedra.AAC.1